MSRFLAPRKPSILRFSGPDAARFLNGQLTQEVGKSPEQSLPACVTDAKGRLQYFTHLFQGPDSESWWITCPSEHSEGLFDRIDRYLIADEVEIEDLSGQWTLIHASEIPAGTAPTFTRTATGPFGEGVDCWWQGEAPTFDFLSDDQAEALRISARIPAWGAELETGMLPPEAGLDRSAISYHKGCYIGQEVLSRIKSAGKVNRRLAAFELEGSADPGDLLLVGEKEVGRLTSISGSQALGYLRKTGFDADSFSVTRGDANIGTATFAGWA